MSGLPSGADGTGNRVRHPGGEIRRHSLGDLKLRYRTRSFMWKSVFFTLGLVVGSGALAATPWWDRTKVRFFWGQWSHLDGVGVTSAQLMPALAKAGATVYVNHGPDPIPEQLARAAAARQAGLRFFGAAYISRFPEIAAAVKAPLAVDAKGETSSRLPHPFFEPAYEEWFVKPALALAASGCVDGMHVDWEFYGGNGEGREVYNDDVFDAFLESVTRTAAVPAPERAQWLSRNGFHHKYLEFLRDCTEAMFAGFAARIRAVRPDFLFSSYDGFFGDNLEGGGWRVSGISSGLHSPDAPYFVIDPRHYWDYHAAPWWDSFYSYHHERGYKHIGGTWDNRFSGGQPQTAVGLTRWMVDMALHTDGYWLWFERDFGPADWLNFAAADRRIRALETALDPFLLKGRQDRSFVILREWSGDPDLTRTLKQRTYHVAREHLVRISNVDLYRPLKVLVRFPHLTGSGRWSLRDPLSGLRFSTDGRSGFWNADELRAGLALPVEKRSDQFLLLTPAHWWTRSPEPETLIASQTGMPLREGHVTSANAEPMPGAASAPTRLLFTRTVGLGNRGAQAGWVTGSALFSGNTDAGQVQRLRAGYGNQWSPGWSPDRAQVAFTHTAHGRGQIFVMTAAGTNLRNLCANACSDTTPVWSPDGTRIAFVSDRDADWEIYVMGADGSAPTRLTNHPGVDTAPAWSPDGTRIAYESERGAGRHVYVMNADGREPRPRITLAGDILEPAWSPDGTMLAATALTSYQRGLVLADVGTGKVALPRQPYLHLESPRWSPDGKRIAAIFYNNQERDNAGIALFDLAATDTEDVIAAGVITAVGETMTVRATSLVDVNGIRPHPGGGRKGFPSWYAFGSQAPGWIVKTFSGLSWSPDGTRLAFSSDMGQGGEFKIYTVPALLEQNHDRVGFYLYQSGSLDNVVVQRQDADGSWHEAFRDGFERPELGRDWDVLEGQFSIADGRLSGHGIILCTRPLPGPQRLEYDASAEAGSTGDLSAFLAATGRDPWAGVLYAFGSFDNTFSKLQFDGETVVRSDSRIVPGQTHHILCERDGVELRHLIDGKLVHRYTAERDQWPSAAAADPAPAALPGSVSAWPQQTDWGP